VSRTDRGTSALKVDSYNEAANPYGKQVDAFMVVEGWRISYLLYLIGSSLVCSICVVCVGAAVTRSFEAGLTAGTYCLGLASVALTAMTISSYIL
jgi:hypothetical protein